MKVAVRYYTRSGNTEKLAKAIGDALSVQAENINVPLEEKADILFPVKKVFGARSSEANGILSLSQSVYPCPFS